VPQNGRSLAGRYDASEPLHRVLEFRQVVSVRGHAGQTNPDSFSISVRLKPFNPSQDSTPKGKLIVKKRTIGR
jgi:hypothetical protein